MQFTIEERHLADLRGGAVPDSVTFHTCKAASVEDAVNEHVGSDGGEIIGKVQTFPGFQGMATVRKPTGVYTLTIGPSSQQLRTS